MMNFLKDHSHDVFCWSWAMGICGLLLVIMLLVDYAWNAAYKKGYSDCLRDKGLTSE